MKKSELRELIRKEIKCLQPGGYCICPSCGEKIPHKENIRCNEIKCPKCSNLMIKD